MVDFNKERTEETPPSKYSSRCISCEENEESNILAIANFWRAVVLVGIAVALGLLSVYVPDDGFSKLTGIGAWCLGILGFMKFFDT